MKLNRRDAECVMYMVGLMTILELADMEDFLEVMLSIEEQMIELPEDSADYLIHVLKSIHQDS